MFIWENDDGSVVYTGSFHKLTWDAYWHERGLLAPAAGGFPAEEPAEDETADSDDDGEAGDDTPADPPETKTAKKAAKKTAAPAKKDGD